MQGDVRYNVLQYFVALCSRTRNVEQSTWIETKAQRAAKFMWLYLVGQSHILYISSWPEPYNYTYIPGIYSNVARNLKY